MAGFHTRTVAVPRDQMKNIRSLVLGIRGTAKLLWEGGKTEDQRHAAFTVLTDCDHILSHSAFLCVEPEGAPR